MVSADGPGPSECVWTKESGPGEVGFERPRAETTWATTTVPGKYAFKIRATNGNQASEATTAVNVYPSGSGIGNPILPGMFADPHILYDDGTFYIFATSMENETGAYGRAAIWSSKDFVHWEMRLSNWPVYG